MWRVKWCWGPDVYLVYVSGGLFQMNSVLWGWTRALLHGLASSKRNPKHVLPGITQSKVGMVRVDASKAHVWPGLTCGCLLPTCPLISLGMFVCQKDPWELPIPHLDPILWNGWYWDSHVSRRWNAWELPEPIQFHSLNRNFPRFLVFLLLIENTLVCFADFTNL